MGNKRCQQCKEKKQQNNAYGEYQIVIYQGKQLAVISKTLTKKSNLISHIETQLLRRQQLACKHIIRLQKFQIEELSQLIHLKLYYEFMTKSLNDLLKQMHFKNEEISQKWLFSLMYGVQVGLQGLQELGIRHGCINLNTILYKSNIFKITDISSTTNTTSYSLALQGNKSQFLSQKLLNYLSFSLIQPQDIDMKDDLFSVGLIVLMIINKARPQDFYIWQQSQKHKVVKFNHKYIEQCLRIMSRNYSVRLCNKVRQYLGRIGNDKSQSKTHHTQNSWLSSELVQLNRDVDNLLGKVQIIPKYTPSRGNSTLQKGKRTSSTLFKGNQMSSIFQKKNFQSKKQSQPN